MHSSHDRWSAGLLVLAIIASMALCVPALRGQALSLDEHGSYFASGAPTLEELWKRVKEVTALPPLSYLLERLSLALGGHSETVLRIPSLLAYVLSIPAAWWLGRIAGGPLCGGLTATVVAWHPGVLDEVRFARCYGLTLLLSTLSMAFLLRWRSEPTRLQWLVAWTITAVALLWTHYLAALLIGAEALVLIVVTLKLPGSRRSTASWCTFAAFLAISIVSLPLAYPVFRLNEWGPVMEYQRQTPSTFTAVGAAWTFSALAVVISVPALSMFLPRPAADESGSARSPFFAVMACWLIPLILLAAMAVTTSPMLAVPRYRVMIAPASSLAAAIVLARAFSPAIATLAAAGLLVFSTILTGSSPFVAGRLVNTIEEEWKRAGLEFAPRLQDQSVLVFTQTGLAEGSLLPALPDHGRLRDYVACRLGAFYTGSERAIPIPLLWDGRAPLLKTYRGFLQSPEVRTVWIVGAIDTDLNVQSIQQVADVIGSAGFKQVSAEDRPGVVIMRFDRTAE